MAKKIIKKTKNAPTTSLTSKAKIQKAEAPKNAQTLPTTYKRGSLGKSIYAYFDECKKSKTEPNYESLAKIVFKILPSSKFNKGHYSWYKNKWNLTN